VKNLAKEFKDFIAGGNMIELAVAVILATAIGRVITAFTDGIMMNIVAAIFGKPSFDDVRIKISDKEQELPDGTFSDGTYLEIGRFITAFIALVLTGLVLFAIIKAYNKMKKAKEEAPAGPSEVDLLTEIRDALKAR
jgi:large conductance mechanosensitive channel